MYIGVNKKVNQNEKQIGQTKDAEGHGEHRFIRRQDCGKGGGEDSNGSQKIRHEQTGLGEKRTNSSSVRVT